MNGLIGLAGMFVSLRIGAIALIPNVLPMVGYFGALGLSWVTLSPDERHLYVAAERTQQSAHDSLSCDVCHDDMAPGDATPRTLVAVDDAGTEVVAHR